MNDLQVFALIIVCVLIAAVAGYFIGFYHGNKRACFEASAMIDDMLRKYVRPE